MQISFITLFILIFTFLFFIDIFRVEFKSNYLIFPAGCFMAEV